MTPAEELIIVSDLMAKISRKLDSVSAENADLRAKLAAENAKLKAVVEAARWLRVVELQRAKIGMTYGAETQNIAERDLDAALSALDAKGGG